MIGTLSPLHLSTRGSFAELSGRIEAAGLMRPTYAWYTARIAGNTALLGAGYAVLVLGGPGWWQLLTAVFLAFCYTQTGVLGHDAAHRQVTRHRGVTDAIGLIYGNLLLGFSYGWWVGHHNRHHSHPNHVEQDPDILRRLVVFTPEQGRRRHGVLRWIVQYQGMLFMPLMVLDSVGLRVASIRALRQGIVRRRRLEAGLMLVHLVAYLGVVGYALSVPQAVVFVVVHQALFGIYLGSIFAPNHKGMPVYGGDEEPPWLQRQVLTSRNVRGGLLVDMWYGGLNYQIEHHLFPGMPRPHLRRAAAMVRAYCAEHDIPYHEVSAPRSYAEIATYLTRISRAV
jgi:fatty acid desaturase